MSTAQGSGGAGAHFGWTTVRTSSSFLWGLVAAETLGS